MEAEELVTRLYYVTSILCLSLYFHYDTFTGWSNWRSLLISLTGKNGALCKLIFFFWILSAVLSSGQNLKLREEEPTSFRKRVCPDNKRFDFFTSPCRYVCLSGFSFRACPLRPRSLSSSRGANYAERSSRWLCWGETEPSSSREKYWLEM